LPLAANAYGGRSELPTAEPQRTYLPPSVSGTLQSTAAEPSGPPLTVEEALSAIDAEVYARTTTVEAAIAEARSKGQSDRASSALPRIHGPQVAAAASPRPAPIGPLVADPLVRPPAPARKPWTGDGTGYRGLAKRLLRIVGIVAACWLAVVLVLMIAYRFVNPPISSLMLQRWLSGQEIRHEWADLHDISPNVVRAVLVSEDARFCYHNGIDYVAIENAIEDAENGNMRGASTISMQVVKNLFLWPSKSYLRKAIELPLTYVLELFWPKRRIMEVYLNIAEWGPGIFGIETAAQYHFHKHAKSLGMRDSARLAVALPNPLKRNAGKPGPGTRRLANAVRVRMRLAPSRQTACIWPKGMGKHAL
jgi:monofunctional biosynthetic peptidoglycan transglycosylase